MATVHQVQQTVACCVATIARYHDAGRTRRSTLLMIAEVQVHAAWVLDLGLGMGETIETILRPVEDELIRRYGHELGVRFSSEFLKAFEGFIISAQGHCGNVAAPR